MPKSKKNSTRIEPAFDDREFAGLGSLSLSHEEFVELDKLAEKAFAKWKADNPDKVRAFNELVEKIKNGNSDTPTAA
ncbi:MAG: hypothetical protein MUD08_07135 [Cytophagales bacterium]|jgi:hypothetical protein|nr:hypothetical protein [Cytophagales bacterium]